MTGLRSRSAVLVALRTWFVDNGYLEVPTPVLVPSAAMEENLHPLAADGGFLRTSPEFALKRAVASGLPRIYEIGPCFRGRESGAWHHTEFLMLEWYRVGASTADLMDEVERLVSAAASALDVPSPQMWPRKTVTELFAAHGIDLPNGSPADLHPDETDWDHAFYRRWVETIEPALPPACFVTGWPASQAALANIRDDRSWPVADRFEAYLGGIELANAFGELRDADRQRARFHAANAVRNLAGEPSNPVDEAFIDAVGRLPPTAGIAMGVDRLVAILTGAGGIECTRVS